MALELPPSDVPFTERFHVLSRIGEGSMGVVYQLHDAQLQQSVAAKALRALDPEEIYRLKKEFRTLSSLRHPNLVRLHELFVGDEHCFFTMELVAGAGFVEHVRGRPGGTGNAAPDHERLRDALGQLASALGFLHGEGKIHRDVKPGNVLVEPTGRVVVLDFGLATDLVSKDSVHSRAGVLAGTFAYMSPEQMAGAALSPAADAYAVGVMLYEALTGRLPFEGPGLTGLLDREHRAPPSPRAIQPEVPEDLEGLTVDLLAPAPEDRPSSAEIAGRLNAGRLDSVRTQVAVQERVGLEALARDAFVGRETELEVLRRALTESAEVLGVVRVSGASGIGKTALVERFLAELDPAESAVFCCLCHPRETVPFKGVDGLVDGLARLLTHQEGDEIRSVLPRNAGALLRTFPVLGRVAELAAAADKAPPAAEPPERRRQAFEALRELVGRLAERQRLVLWIDDAQWGDADSGQVLRELCRGPDPPRLLLILSSRLDTEVAPGAEDAALLRELDEMELGARRLEVGPLGEAELRAVVEGVLGSRGRERLVAAVVEEAAGSPFLAIELARSSAEAGGGDDRTAGLKHLMAQRVESLGTAAREVLQHLAVAGHPLQERVLVSALGRPLERRWDLAQQRLIRLLPYSDGPALATYHDSITEAVLDAMPEARIRQLHRRLAGAFQGFPGLYDESLVDHFVAAGDVEAAGSAAYDAAEGALAASAFHQAVALYGRALDLDTDRCPRWLLLAKLAECSVNAGRGADSASRFLEAADELELLSPQDVQVAALRRRAAFEFLRSGLYTEGSETLRDAFRHLGMSYPDTTLRALYWILGGRARWRARRGLLGTRRGHAGPPPTPRQRESLELLWAAGQGHSFLDMTRGAAFQTVHASLALRLGDSRHLSRALSTEGLFVAWEKGTRSEKQSSELLLEAEQLAVESGDPAVRAHNMLMRSVTHLLSARWRQTLVLSEQGEALCLSECRGASWELASFHQNILAALTNLGELQLVGPRIESTLRQAVDRGDRFAMAILPIGPQNLAWLAADDPDEAERRIAGAVGPAFEERSYWYLYQAELARTQIDVYRGEPGAGIERVDRMWKSLRSGWMLRFPGVRCVLRDLRARCALAAAEQAPEGEARERLVRRAVKDSRRNRREPFAWFGPYVDRTEGVAAALSGDTVAAVTLLERSSIAFQHLEMGLHSAGVRFRLGALAPTPTTAAAQDASALWMREHGVLNPKRMAALC